MAEEVNEKKGEEKKTACVCSKKGVKVVLGTVLIAMGVLAVIIWWPSLLTVISGLIGLFLIIAGLIVIAISKE